MRSLNTVSFITPKSFGVDLNLREWRVGKRGNNKKRAACFYTAVGFPNLELTFLGCEKQTDLK